MAVITRTAGGIKYDTAVKEVSQKSTPMPTPTKSTGSGDAKIAASKASSSSTSMPTPKEYNDMAEAKKADSTVQPVHPSEPASTTRTVTQSEIEALRNRYTQSTQLSIAEQTLAKQNQERLHANVTPTYFNSPTTGKYEKSLGTVIRETAQKAASPINTMTIVAQEEGYEKTKEYEMSGISRSIYDKTQSAANQIRTVSPYLQASRIGTPLYAISQKTDEFIASNLEMAGMIPGGVETIAKNPGVIAPALVVGVSSVPSGIAQQAREDPGQLAFDTVAFAAVSGGVGGVVKGIKAKTPKIALKSSPQEAIIKIEMPVSSKPIDTGIKITEMEYKASGFGIDSFATKKYASPDLITIEQPARALSTVNKPMVFAGKEVRPGVQEVYIRANKEQAKNIASQFDVSVRDISTEYGSFLEISPKSKLDIPKEITPQITTRQSKFGLPESPVRIEQKVELTPTSLDKIEVPKRLMLDQWETVGAKAKTEIPKERRIPEYGTLDTMISAEEVAYAKIFSTALRDSPEYYNAVDAVSSRILPKMGVKNVGNVRFKIVSRDSKQFMDLAEGGMEGLTQAEIVGGKTYNIRTMGEKLKIIGVENVPTQVIIPESTIIKGNIPRIVGHEFGHAFLSSGSSITSPIAKTSLEASRVYSEAIAEQFGARFAREFQKTYGIKADAGKSFVSDIPVKDRLKLIKQDPTDPYILGFSAADMGIPLGRVASRYKTRGKMELDTVSDLQDTEAAIRIDDAVVTSKKRKPSPQQMVSIQKPPIQVSPELQSMLNPKYQNMIFGKQQLQTAMLERQTLRMRARARQKTITSQQNKRSQFYRQQTKQKTSEQFAQSLKQEQLRQYTVNTLQKQMGITVPKVITMQRPAMLQRNAQVQMPALSLKSINKQSFMPEQVSIVGIDQTQKTGQKTYTDTITKTMSDTMPDIPTITTSTGLKNIKPPKVPKLGIEDKKKRKTRKGKTVKSARFTQLYNPLRDAKDLFGIGRIK